MRRGLLDVLFEALYAPLGHLEVGEYQLVGQVREIPHGVDVVKGAGDRLVFKGAHDGDQGIAQTHVGKGGGVDVVGARPGDKARQVDVLDGGVGDLFRLEKLRQPVDPLVDDVRGAQARLALNVPSGGGVRQAIEDGGLAALAPAAYSKAHRFP